MPTLLSGQLEVSRETYERLLLFKEIFEHWNKRINLVASSTAHDVWQRHIEDSAQLLLIKPDMRSVVDLGSGGGFPGMVLAVLLDDFPDSKVQLIESNRKKTGFLQVARTKCAKRAIIHSSRIEKVIPTLKTTDYITGRALTRLLSLLEMTQTQLSKGIIGLFHKGAGYEEEVEECYDKWKFDLIVHRSIIDDNSVILEISNLNPRAPLGSVSEQFDD